jgi:thiamine kinase-like enzyme
VELARRIHALPTEIAVEEDYAHAERYRQRLESAGIALPAPLAALDDRIRDEHACGSDKPDAIRVCHRDLNRANIIDCAGRLYVIDWEYATRGAAAFDFAALTTEWHLPRTRVCRAASIERDVLEHALRLYRYTCALWHLLSANAGRS